MCIILGAHETSEASVMASSSSANQVKEAKRKAVSQITGTPKSFAAAHPSTNNVLVDEAAKTLFVALQSVITDLIEQEALTTPVFEFVGKEKARLIDMAADQASTVGVETLRNMSCLEMIDQNFWIAFLLKTADLIEADIKNIMETDDDSLNILVVTAVQMGKRSSQSSWPSARSLSVSSSSH